MCEKEKEREREGGRGGEGERVEWEEEVTDLPSLPETTDIAFDVAWYSAIWGLWRVSRSFFLHFE